MEYPIKKEVQISENERGLVIDGDALLPPSPDPVYYDFRKDGEVVKYVPPIKPDTEDEHIRRYWRFGDGYVSHPNDPTFAEDNLPIGVPTGFGNGLGAFPDVVEMKFKPQKRKNPGIPASLFCHGNHLIVGTRLLEILKEYGGSAIDHRPLIMRDLDGNVYDDDHHFMDVTRCIKAVDYANSHIKYEGVKYSEVEERRRSSMKPQKSECEYRANVRSHMSVRLLDNIDPELHIFRQAHPLWYSGSHVIISYALRRVLKAQKPAFRNIGYGNLAYGI